MQIMKMQQDWMVSIHAPIKGATFFERDNDYDTKCFNPCSHKGSNADMEREINEGFNVSIHAPIKGATTVRPML